MADSITEIPPNPLLSKLAKGLRGAYDFATENNPPVQMIGDLFGAPSILRTADRLATGEALTKGKGMTLALQPDVADSAIAAAGLLNPASKLLRATKGLPVGMSIKAADDLPGAINGTGYHFSKASRPVLDSGAYGTGLKGSAREAITDLAKTDPEAAHRISLYTPKNGVVQSENGVGPYAQKVDFTGVYDAKTNPQRFEMGDQRAFEKTLRDKGYNGYFDPMEGSQPGQVVMLGKRQMPTKELGLTNGKLEGLTDVTGATPVPPRGRDVHVEKLRDMKDLPAGELRPERWGETLAVRDPELHAAVEPLGVFQPGGKPQYKDSLIRSIKDATEAPDYSIPAGPSQAEIDAVVSKFGAKHLREEANTAKVARQVNAAPPVLGAKAPGEGGRQAAVAPDVYRQIYAEGGPEALAAALRGDAHLRPNADGTFVGAPRTVRGMRGINAMRKDSDAQLVDAAEALRVADPTRVGNWYERAMKAQAASAEPYQLARNLDQHSVYSAGADPSAETVFTLKHATSRAMGVPQTAKFRPMAERLDRAVDTGTFTELGPKTGEYRVKIDPTEQNISPFGVGDFRDAQKLGYTNPDGSPWQGGASPTMHPFMDAETALQVERANALRMGGRANWSGATAQESPWIVNKAQDFYKRGVNGRYAPTPEGDRWPGIKAALRDANNTQGDAFPQQTFTGTYETAPGKSTGMRPDYQSMTPEQKLAFDNTGRWDTPAPELDPRLADPKMLEGGVGEGRRDAIYRAMDFRTLPTQESLGNYGGMNERMREARVLVPQTPTAESFIDATGKMKSRPTPNMQSMPEDISNSLNFSEKFRAAVDAQEAGAGNLVDLRTQQRNPNSVLLDTRDKRSASDPWSGRQPTAQELQDVEALLPPKWMATATNRGMLAFPENNAAASNVADTKQLMGDMSKALRESVPGSTLHAGIVDDSNVVYTPGIGKWGADGIEASTPFSGEATSALLEAGAKAPPGVARGMSESDELRNIIRQKTQRDAGMPGERKDIQNMRNFLSEADWNKAVEMIRAGMKPAAAVAALGYSINSMAGQEK